MTFSAAQTVCCGRDEAEFRKRAEAIGRDPADLRANGVAGTVAEVVDAIGGTPPPGRPGCTCRRWTWTTSTTSS
jgi:hypothetical protein